MKIKSLGLDDIKAVEWDKEKKVLNLVDQRQLPFNFEIKEHKSVEDVCFAIEDMVVRGAPTIGSTAAYGMVIAVLEVQKFPEEKKRDELEKRYEKLLQTRPTAVDLKNYATEVKKCANLSSFSYEACLDVAEKLTRDIIEECKKIGENGEKIISDGDTILTHCHAGALATVDVGTALSPIKLAHQRGKKINVLVDETRPRLQGARITAWELKEEGISHQIITDNSATFLMSRGLVDKIILGADRCLIDGTIANKIGTLSLAVSANYYNIPFYSAFPWSTIDMKSISANDIIIETRDENEVKYVKSEKGKVLIANKTSPALNTAFDITPPSLITGYITPSGILSKKKLEKEIKERRKI